MIETIFSGRRLALAAAVTCALGTSLAQARTLETAFGDVEIDGQPERVVTLYEGALDASLTAGVKPLGAVATRGGDGVADYLGDAADGISIVGTARETNMEAVVAQRPDLILASSRLPREQYALLSRVAPTIVPPSEGFSPEAWKEEARLFGDALDRRAAIDEALTAIENRSQSLAARQRDGDTGAATPSTSPSSGTRTSTTRTSATRTSATLARWMPQGPLVMSSRIFSSGLLAATGFEVDDGGVVKAGRPHSDPLSLENLSRIDSDWLFLATLNADGQAALDSARQTPAFARLEVVHNDHVVPVDGQLWTSASGPIAAERILDDIEAVLDRDAMNR
ncbi:ABC transporter substrate-binding protein [Salinicola halophilus]|uniref:ABC transporter substrate-binding protein n=1 Tax=Salinicola halophilus TaxID=184065 RepID=UPI000DA14165|nr:ABC transporter substrate-binding protein [Salinicola halophilus]